MAARRVVAALEALKQPTDAELEAVEVAYLRMQNRVSKSIIHHHRTLPTSTSLRLLQLSAELLETIFVHCDAATLCKLDCSCNILRRAVQRATQARLKNTTPHGCLRVKSWPLCLCLCERSRSAAEEWNGHAKQCEHTPILSSQHMGKMT